MKTRLKQSSWSRLAGWFLLMITLVSPAFPVLASTASHPDLAQIAVTASAVIVPTRTSQLGFLTSGIAREVPVKEGDSVTTGQPLIVLDTPELEFAVTEAQ